MTGFWVFMLVMALLIPIIMLGFGILFLHRAPKNINAVFGYRTAMSMKNRETWEFAHSHCGKLWIRFGAVLLPASVVPILLVIGRDADTVGTVCGIVCGVQVLLLVLSVIPTERALKATFDQNGNKK